MAKATSANGRAYTFVDHKFDVVVVGAGGAGLRATLGRLRHGRHLTIRRAKVVRVLGEAPLQIDGDYGGKSPVEVSLLPTRARLYAPSQHRG